MLDLLFEPSPAIHDTLLPVIRTAQYTSYPELIDACQIRLLSLAAASSASDPDPRVLSALGSHPRLGEKHVESEQSAAEQANIRATTGDDDDVVDQLRVLNDEYEAKFPGLRYVVWVNGRGRPEIMDDMRARIEKSDYSKEVDAALQVRKDHGGKKGQPLFFPPSYPSPQHRDPANANTEISQK